MELIQAEYGRYIQIPIQKYCAKYNMKIHNIQQRKKWTPGQLTRITALAIYIFKSSYVAYFMIEIRNFKALPYG